MPTRITPGKALPLHSIHATRTLELAAAALLPEHRLMQRAGLATARLAMALAPHANRIWIACGPGNNGGDGLEAAMHLQRWGMNPIVGLIDGGRRLPADAQTSLERARRARVSFADEPPRLDANDLGIDALLGIGARHAPGGVMAQWLTLLRAGPAPWLAVDLPSGLDADTGALLAPLGAAPPTHGNPAGTQGHTLSLLTCKPGLFTAQGRDSCGTLWFDDLGVSAANQLPVACLNAAPTLTPRPHASHKGSYGDVAVIGGEAYVARGMGMTGAALLAASAALHGGAGRVLLSLLGHGDEAIRHTAQPELMLRRLDRLALNELTAVCGCGGGDAVAEVLPQVLRETPRLVLDADALNVIAADPALQLALRQRADHGQATVLTPHPLEAARLLGTTSRDVQQARLQAANFLVQKFACTVMLKGSGTIIAAPAQTPVINPTGNARLASAGTGDVLAGMTGARLAAGEPAFSAACAAAYIHGLAADRWPQNQPLTASVLARQANALSGLGPAPSARQVGAQSVD